MEKAFPASLTDARDRRLTLAAPPRRIVSLVPSQTELLVWLGLHEELVGITRFCVRPDGLKDEKQIVGGTKSVNVERVKALQPDLVLANWEENTRETVDAIEAFAPVYVTDVKTVPGAAQMIRAVGQLVARASQAEELAQLLLARFEALPERMPLRATYLIWRDPFMTVGHDTIIHDVMTRAGFENAFADRTRYPEVTLEEIENAKPAVLLLPDEPFPFPQKEAFHADLREAFPNTPLEFVDGQLFSWYGPRLAEAPAYLSDLREGLST